VGWELQVDHILPRSPRRRDLPGTPDEELDAPENLAADYWCSRRHNQELVLKLLN
jgi:hypothetical protein